MVDINNELRNLMDLYIKRFETLVKEEKEAKEDGDVDAELMCEGLQKQCRIMIAELFKTMKNLGVLDGEEIEFGSVKNHV